MTIYKGTDFIAGGPTNYVTTDTQQVVTGAKTFTNSISIRNSESVAGVFGANGVSFKPVTTANSGGFVEFHYNGTSSRTSRIIEAASGYLRIDAINPTDNSETSSLYFGYTNGSFLTRCPASDSANSILTAVSTGADYVKLGNGVIIQWGEITSTGSQTITFPQPFTSADSYAMGMIGRTGDSSFTDSITNLTETSFTANRRSGTVPFRWIAIGK